MSEKSLEGLKHTQKEIKSTSPAMSRWQVERLVAQLMLVSEHASDSTCPCQFSYYSIGEEYQSESCIPKHLLLIEAYCLETIPMVTDEGLKGILNTTAEEAREIKEAEIRKACNEEVEQVDVTEWSRSKRKLLEPYIYQFACAVPEGEKTGTIECCSYRMKPSGEVLLTCRKNGGVLEGLYPNLEDAKKEAAQFCGVAPVDEAIVKEVIKMFDKEDNGSGAEDEVIKAVKEANLEQSTLSAVGSAAITGAGIAVGFRAIDWLARKFSEKKSEEGGEMGERYTYYCAIEERHPQREIIQIETLEKNPKCPYCGGIMTYGSYWRPLPQLEEGEAPYARQIPIYVEVWKTTIEKHYHPTMEECQEGSIRVVKPEKDVLVYLCCKVDDDWNADTFTCSPNPSVHKTITPNTKKYRDELDHLKLVHPEIKVNYRTKEVGVEPVVSEEEQKELEAVEEALKHPEEVA